MANYNKGEKNNNYKHGMNRTRLHRIWTGIKTRCLNSNDYHYKWYGARGISICDEWMEFKPFAEWALSHGYQDGLTIDRTDNDGDYTPSNCRWVTQAEQCQNHRPRSSKSGIPYVQLCSGGYRVQIRRGGAFQANKLFRSLPEAISYRDAILKEL